VHLVHFTRVQIDHVQAFEKRGPRSARGPGSFFILNVNIQINKQLVWSSGLVNVTLS